MAYSKRRKTKHAAGRGAFVAGCWIVLGLSVSALPISPSGNPTVDTVFLLVGTSLLLCVAVAAKWYAEAVGFSLAG